MVSPYKAPAIGAILAAVNRRWPNRSRVSDGWIGDTAHASRISDHNPNAVGAVLAYDFTVAGIDPAELIAALVKDERVRYIIFNRQIAYVDDNFRIWWPYRGSNPHEKHIHVSVRQDRRYWGDSRDFRLSAPAPTDWFTMATPDDLRKIVREEIANSAMSGRVLNYLDAKNSETLGIVRRISGYTDAKTSEVLAIVRGLKTDATSVLSSLAGKIKGGSPLE